IALINRALEVKKTEVNEEIRIRDPAKLQQFLDEEEKSLKTMVAKIQESGANIVLGQKGIDDRSEEHTSELQSRFDLVCRLLLENIRPQPQSTLFPYTTLFRSIALINRALEVKKTEVNEEIRIRDPAKLQQFLDEEEKSLKTMVAKIQESGANIVLGQKGIDD